MASPLLTVSIPTWNRGEHLRQYLEQLKTQIRQDALESDVAIHVQDNGSSDGTGRMAAEFQKTNPALHFTYSKNPSNLGFDRNVDLAARASRTPWTWLSGDDDALAPASLKFLVEKIRSLPPDVHFLTILVNVYTSDLSQLIMDFSKQYAGDVVWQGVSPASARFYNKYHFLGNHLFKTEKWKQTPILEKYVGSEIVQLPFILYWIARGEKIAFFNRVTILQRYNNSASSEDKHYTIFWGCLHDRSQMVHEIFPDERSRRLMLVAFFQPFAMFSFRKSEQKGWLPSPRAIRLFEAARKYYSFYWKFWLFYPAGLLTPPAGARLLKSAINHYRILKHRLKGIGKEEMEQVDF